MKAFNIERLQEIDTRLLESHYAIDRNFNRFKNVWAHNMFSKNLWTSPSLGCLDAMLYQILFTINNPKVEAYFIEAGANNGLRQSNTFVFEQCFGWKGLLVEPVLYNYKDCLTYRNKETKCILGCLSSYDGEIEGIFDDSLKEIRTEKDDGLGAGCTDFHTESYPELIKSVKCFTYETLCKTNSVPNSYALLSLDVEEHERNIITDTCFSTYRPALICIETHDESVIRDIICQKYTLFKQDGHNFFLGDETV